MTEGRVVLTYVCARRQHVLADVIAEPGGRLIIDVRAWPLHIGLTRNRKAERLHVPLDDLEQEPFGPVALMCSCDRAERLLTAPDIRRDMLRLGDARQRRSTDAPRIVLAEEK